ncbi:hypothetical protein INT48_005516 [Thamnidium elegans]|uniref:Phospholipase n=1 Tax=Thamnidium elegans TaxID=101142 RepID=A0A8H7SZV0_9FUNG|nr:hypothetical protein INT48_005516 [Thamnidium elegans]
MSHPIMNNMEFIHQRKESGGYEEDDENSFGSEKQTDPSKWHSILRRMSINIQRDEGTPDSEIISGRSVAHPTDHERALMLNIPHYSSSTEDLSDETIEDNTLPTVDEIVTDYIDSTNNMLHKQQPSYFENPFDTDTASTDDTVFVQPTTDNSNKKIVHPLMKIETEKNHHGILASNSMRNDSAQGANNKAKLQWAKTFEKIKVVNSIGHHQSSQQRRNSIAPHTITKQPLAPYYPAAFTPGYLSLLCRDEHGRKPVAITDSEIDQTSIQRLWTFRIELQYGEIKWVINRTIIEFYNLHLTLKFKYISGLTEQPPSFPSQLSHLTNAALTSMRLSREEEDVNTGDTALKRRDALEVYLKDLVQQASMIINYELCEFLELSAVSIVKDMGWKGKEGYLEYNTNPASFRSSFGWHRWKKEWIILRDSYIGFCKDIGSKGPTDVLLFDRNFKVTRSQSTFGSIHQTHFIISNSARRIEVKGPTSRHIDEWIENLDKVQKESPWIMNHRFGSFAPIRENAKAKWFVDGHDYYEAVAQAILSAKSEIYIEDWWLYLRRPPKGNEEYRLDRLLKRKACEGVMIYIVIYKNVSVALPLDSQHTRDWMHNVHPNIIVQRHANLTSSPFWAHHEKILVVDYRLAFVGGLDLCFGRYDTQRHDLTDHSSHEEIFPGQDYSNPRIKDFHKVSQYDMELINKKNTARMPWHDIHTAMTGPPARDIARHFIQRWNFIKSNRAKERAELPFLLPKVTTTSPHDKLIKNKIGQALVERIKRAHKENQKFRVIVVIPVAPGFEGDFIQVDRRSMPLRSVAQYQYRSICRGKHSVFEQLKKADIPVDDYIGFYSLRNWGKVKTPDVTIRKESNGSSIIKDSSIIQSPQLPHQKRNIINKRRTINKSRTINQSKSVEDFASLPMSQQVLLIQQQEELLEQQNMYNDGRLDYVTEQVYIHSKLMIVDDKTVICGSANLNDRSQLGNRDSEIAVVIEDTDLVDSRMNGQPYKATRYALTLRMQLFKEHLGLLNCGNHTENNEQTQEDNMGADGYRNMKREDVIVMDPLHDEFYQDIWNVFLTIQVYIYIKLVLIYIYSSFIFLSVVHSVEQHRQFVPDPSRVLPGHIAEPWKLTNDQVHSKLKGIRGHLVQFPTEYLKNISMTASVIQEAVPPIVFT